MLQYLKDSHLVSSSLQTSGVTGASLSGLAADFCTDRVQFGQI